MQNLNRISLGGLRAIEAVGRLGNLGRAAEEIGVTPGAISQQILKTEQLLGLTMFDRRPRGLALTARGEEVLPHLSRGMAELSAAVTAAERRASDAIAVSVAPVFAAKWLVWRLSRFNEQHPDIRIRIDATSAMVDPNTDGVEACIRVGTGKWPDVKAVKLVDQRVFPVCSPALAARLVSPKDLARVPVIRDRHEMFGWRTWLEPNGLSEDVLGDGPVFSDASLCLDAAIAGQGVFLAWETLAFDALKAGRLVAPFPGRFRNGFSYWFVVGRHGATIPGVREFETWLRAEMNSDCCPGHQFHGIVASGALPGARIPAIAPGGSAE